jgi:chlorobactene glucosyltransferase
MIFAAIVASVALIVITLTAVLNILTFPHLKKSDTPKASPCVSILIPARNEAAIIEKTVHHVLRQTYPNFEVIVLDDNSEDGTGTLAQKAASGDMRLRVIHGTPLPDGWMGKSWACHNLAQAAQGEILVFTDADVLWEPQALTAIISHTQKTNADLLTVWSQQIMVTLPERLTVSLVAMVLLGYLPVVMVHHSPFALFAAANGQCMVWKRAAYKTVKGHESVASEVLDDVHHAIIAKKHGLRLRMALSSGLLQTRMYTDWQSVRNGYAKNLLAGYLNSVPLLLLGTVMHWLMFIFPLVMLLSPTLRLWGVCLLLLGIGTRALTAALTRQPVWDALLMPVSVLLMTVIATQSIYWYYTGGPRWKGRVIRQVQK